jgi:DNA replication and repair protein RecF
VKHEHLSVYKDYQKALKQRNSLLKKKSLENLDYWTDILSTLGESLNSSRKSYFETLNKEFVNYKQNILDIMPDAYDDIKSSSLEYNQGWDNEYSLSDALNNNIDKDIIMKHTTCGPHRCDIYLSSAGYDLKSISSMSTQIITGLLLVLSQSRVFHVKHEHYPIILIDDLFFWNR